MDKKRAIIPILLVAAGIAYAVWYYTAGSSAEVSGAIQGSGTIEAQEVNLGSQIAAEITAINGQEGSGVKKGDVVVKLDDRILRDQIISALAGVDAAQAAVDDAGNKTDRDIAQAQLKQAQAALETAKIQKTFADIASPIDGTIVSLPFSIGEVATPGSTVAVIGKTDKFKLVVFVDEANLGRIKVGQATDVSVDAYPNETFKAKVVDISSEAEFTPQNVQTKEQRTNLVFAVTIELKNIDNKLKAGMPADAVLVRK